MSKLVQHRKVMARHIPPAFAGGSALPDLPPLFHAIMSKDEWKLKFLLDSKASLLKTNQDENTPLMYAAEQEWLEGVALLLDRKASCSPTNNHGRNVVHIAACIQNTGLMQLIVDHCTSAELLCQDVEGMSPLHWASLHGIIENMECLLSAKFTLIRQKDDEGKTALHWAALNGSVIACELLLNHEKSLINLQDMEGRSPLHLAAAAGHLAVALYLGLAPLCNIDLPDNMGRTPLHWACALNKPACVAGLLVLGAKAHIADKHGVTPLRFAKHFGFVKCASLIEKHLPERPYLTRIPVKMAGRRSMTLGDARRLSSDELLAPDLIGGFSEMDVSNQLVASGSVVPNKAFAAEEIITLADSDAKNASDKGSDSESEHRYVPQMALSGTEDEEEEEAQNAEASIVDIDDVDVEKVVCKSQAKTTATSQSPSYQLATLRFKYPLLKGPPQSPEVPVPASPLSPSRKLPPQKDQRFSQWTEMKHGLVYENLSQRRKTCYVLFERRKTSQRFISQKRNERDRLDSLSSVRSVKLKQEGHPSIEFRRAKSF